MNVIIHEDWINPNRHRSNYRWQRRVSKNKSNKQPGALYKEIEPTFNKAVIFDTTKNSWHGLPNPLQCPKNQFRKSLAIYYLTEPSVNVNERGKALFAPTEKQQNDVEVLEFIKKRSSVKTAKSVYLKKK